MSEMFEATKKGFYRGTREVFRTQGGETRWAQLSPAYRRWKREHYPGKKILRLTDRMWHAATGQSREATVDIQPKSASFGVSVPYAGRQNRTRPFLQPKVLAKALQKAAVDFVRDLAKRFG